MKAREPFLPLLPSVETTSTTPLTALLASGIAVQPVNLRLDWGVKKHETEETFLKSLSRYE
jgi:hypothetical protein